MRQERKRERDRYYFNIYRKEVKRGRREMKESFRFYISNLKNHCGKYQCPSKEKEHKLERGQDMKKKG